MAQPTPSPDDWLAAARAQQQAGDREVLQLLRDSYNRVQAILKGLPQDDSGGISALISRAQYERTRQELLAEQARVFRRLGDVVSARRLEAAARSAKLSATADAAFLRVVGAGRLGQQLISTAQVTARRGIEAAMIRLGLSAVPLSERIYNTSVWMHNRLNRLINQQLAIGLNARKFAKVARDWFNPSVLGGTRYAALRLARTEINNAFHAEAIDRAQRKPWVGEMEWHLSKSHPRPDGCDRLAAQKFFPVKEIPRRPHPQCMCYVTEREIDEDQWVDRFLSGEFDDWLDSELGEVPEPKQATPAVKQTKTKPVPALNPLAQSVLDQIDVNSVLRSKASGETFTVSEIRGRSVFFTNGTYENMRSLHHYEVVQPPQPVVKGLSGQAVHGIIPKGLFKRGTMTPEQRKALQTYESGWFMVMQDFLRKKLWGDPGYKDEERDVLRIDSAMEESVIPQPIEAWRALFSSRLLFGDRFDKDLTGFSWLELGYSSTTTNERITRVFMTGILDVEAAQSASVVQDSVKMHIQVAAGVQGLETSTWTEGNKANGPQAEITLQRGLVWKVVKDNGIDAEGIRHLEVEVDIQSQEG